MGEFPRGGSSKYYVKETSENVVSEKVSLNAFRGRLAVAEK